MLVVTVVTVRVKQAQLGNLALPPASCLPDLLKTLAYSSIKCE